MTKLSAEQVFSQGHNYVVVDVRSSSEHQAGHVPGAVNVPLFSNDERHLIGCTYKAHGRVQAIKQGLSFVEPKLVSLAEQGQRLAEKGPLLVQCARGGMRSASLLWLWSLVGLDVTSLIGGYKAFRNWVLTEVARPRDFLVLGGKTGTGKTELLAELAQQGESVIDLEGLANHRGSVLGELGLPPQPTQQQFENELAVQLASFPADRRIWIESESRRIGRLQVPGELFRQICQAPSVELDVSLDERAHRLVREYGAFSKERILAVLSHIKKRLGRERFRSLEQMLAADQWEQAAKLLCSYYDQKYAHSSKDLRTGKLILKVPTSQFGTLTELADHLRRVSFENVFASAQ